MSIQKQRDKEKMKLLDSNPYLFPFKNMVYDLHNDIARPIEKEDYITKTTGNNARLINEIPDEEFECIKYFYEMILPKKMKDYSSKCLLQLVYHYQQKKRFWSF